MKRHYKDQGGWEGWTWGGMDRECFVFSDSLQVGGSLCVGAGEGRIGEYTCSRLSWWNTSRPSSSPGLFAWPTEPAPQRALLSAVNTGWRGFCARTS